MFVFVDVYDGFVIVGSSERVHLDVREILRRDGQGVIEHVG